MHVDGFVDQTGPKYISVHVNVCAPRLHALLMIARAREQVLVVQKLTARRRCRYAGVE